MRSYFLPSLISLAFLPAVAVASSIGVAPPMLLGTAASPPLGFTELCQRAPTECVDDARSGAIDAAAKTVELAAIQQWAGKARWAVLFGHADISEAPASAFPGYAIRAQSARPASNLFLGAAFDAPQAVDAAASTDPRQSSPLDETSDAATPVLVAEPPALAAPMVVSEINARDLQRINTRINRSIRRAEDYETYNRADYWAAASDNLKRGDCEDYALAKRRALIEAGTPGEALSIAIVRTRQGEMHAVLLVATTRGEVVLDNLSPWILPWNEAPYLWLDRQAPSAPTQWVHVLPTTQS